MIRSKPIIGYEEIYTIYENGKITSSFRKGSKGGILKIYFEEYPNVRLTKNCKTKKFYLHKLLAIHFIDNPNNMKIVNHKDGNKMNYDLKNLEWCSISENNLHAIRTGLQRKKSGSLNGMSKLNDLQIIEIRDHARRYSPNYGRKELSLKYNVSESTIKDIVTNKSYVSSNNSSK